MDDQPTGRRNRTDYSHISSRTWKTLVDQGSVATVMVARTSLTKSLLAGDKIMRSVSS
jgi:hypothetical protein